MRKALFIVAGVLPLLSACESDNEHFCARYQYVYKQLLEPGLPPVSEMRAELQRKLVKASDDDHARFMLFVLNDYDRQLKPDGEDVRDFCLRRQVWQRYDF